MIIGFDPFGVGDIESLQPLGSKTAAPLYADFRKIERGVSGTL